MYFGDVTLSFVGLSPRVRGSPHKVVTLEPIETAEVYPRVCGGA